MYDKDEALEQGTHEEVQRYYGETLATSDDLKTTACCTSAAPPDYIGELLADIHPEVANRYYGCGLVLPEALDGLHVLDLGCGAGRDVYLLSRLTGPAGHVTGVDMTAAQLQVARAHVDFHTERYGYAEPNVRFLEANIEQLEQTDLADESFDLIVSNCVINLAVDKDAVLRSAWRLLRPGGEMYFSDIYADRRVPAELREDPVLYGECLAGALYWRDFLAAAAAAGFSDPRLVEHEVVALTDPAIQSRVGPLQFWSVTYRLFKVPGAELGQEDYGQQVCYTGSLEACPDEFCLDSMHRFMRGLKTPVSRNTFNLLRASRFAGFFEFFDDNKDHLGPFSANFAEFSDAELTSGSAKGGCC